MSRALLNLSHPFHGYHLALLHLLQSEVQAPQSDLSFCSFHLLWIFPLHLLFDGTSSSVYTPPASSLPSPALTSRPTNHFNLHLQCPLLSCYSLTIFFDCQIGNTSPGSVQPPTFSEVHGLQQPCQGGQGKSHTATQFCSPSSS